MASNTRENTAWCRGRDGASGGGGGGGPENEGWAFDGVSSGVFMTRQRQQRNELTDQSLLLAPLDQ